MELTNHTGYDLEDICAASGGTYYYEDRIEKKLKNGETATCDIVTSNLNNYVGFNMQNDAANGFNTMTSNKRAAINALKNDELVIVGFIKNNNTGDIKVNGRMQSRIYQKKISETEVIEKTAYEISVSKLEILNNVEKNTESNI